MGHHTAQLCAVGVKYLMVAWTVDIDVMRDMINLIKLSSGVAAVLFFKLDFP